MGRDQNVQELLNLLAENGRQGQASDLSALLFYMDGMERQYTAVLKELQEVRGQLEKMSARQSPAKTALHKSLDTLQQRLEALREQMQALREKIGTWAKDTVKNFQIMGVSALDKAASTLHIKPALEAAQENLRSAMAHTKTAIERGEAVGAELRTARQHLRAALYTAVGKQPPADLKGEAGRFQAVVLAPVRGVYKTLSGMNNNALGMIGVVERLEQSAEQGRTSRAEKKPSIRAEMKSLQAEIAARDAAKQKQKEKQPQEAAL